MKLLSILFFLYASLAFSKNTIGPYGGEVRSVGAFQIELRETKYHFIVWLLDQKLKNPTIEESELVVKVMKNHQELARLECVPQEIRFACIKDKKIKLSKKMEVYVRATRGKVKGGITYYAYPPKRNEKIVIK